ncbi:MAG: hypothetical protein ABSG11_11555 [Candidatus Korobacteraceae bacterium]|jgi:hypothetical protein
MASFLEGQVYDPAWLLGRQWQVGEFVGDDAGTPINATLTVTANPLSGYGAGAAPARACGQVALDTLAAPEPRGSMTLFESAEAGAQLVSFLDTRGCSAGGITAIISQYPLPGPTAGTADAYGLSYLSLLAGRVPDALTLEPLLRGAVGLNAVPAQIPITAADDAAFLAAVGDWIEWLDGLVVYAPPSGDAWTDASLDYQFAIGIDQQGTQPLALVASHWDGERNDWFDFDADPTIAAPSAIGAAELPGVDPASGSVTVTGSPSPLSFPGMPPRRLWQFDDGSVNFAQIQLAPEDLARMLVVEFASVYSNDWYLWPLRLPVSAMHVVQTLNVTNTFGETMSIGPAGTAGGLYPAVGDWCLFRSAVVAQAAPAAFNGLLLLAALVDEQRSAPIEEVTFMRDETADLAWAIETTVLSADSRPLDRHASVVADPTQSPAPPSSASSDSTVLTYELATSVPTFWFPLVPDPSGESMFDRLILSRVNAAGAAADVQPAGSILRPGQTLTIRQEAVPQEGAGLERRFHLTRGVDGALLLWCGRTRRIGFGEGSSGLRYDLANG